METLEHTFPMPETEAHKLDELSGQLPSRTQAYVSNNAWMLLALSGMAGCLLAYFWPGKRKR